MLVRTMGSAFVSTAANADEVDYISDNTVEERGRKAIGPILDLLVTTKSTGNAYIRCSVDCGAKGTIYKK